MRRIQKLVKVLLPLAFGMGIVWFILQKVDMQLLIGTVKSGINWTWVVISWAFALLANVVRGIRWRQQLRTVGVNPSLHEMSISFFGNYGMNLVFPRLGEFWRCNYIAQNNRKPFSTIAGTILSERLCDILCSSFLILLALVLEGRVLVKFFFDDESKAEAFQNLLTEFGILELVRTGMVALERGQYTIDEQTKEKGEFDYGKNVL